MKQTIYNLFILDASGSMSNKVSEVINGMNGLLKGIQKGQKKKDDFKNRIFVTDFSSHGDFNILIENEKVKAVAPFTRQTYVPRAMTALYDAIGKSIALIPADAKNVFVTIFTDGLENDSKEFNAEAIKEKIISLKSKGWHFVFFGASEESMYQADNIGINAKQRVRFENSKDGVLYSFSVMNSRRKKYVNSLPKTDLQDESE